PGRRSTAAAAPGSGPGSIPGCRPGHPTLLPEAEPGTVWSIFAPLVRTLSRGRPAPDAGAFSVDTDWAGLLAQLRLPPPALRAGRRRRGPAADAADDPRRRAAAGRADEPGAEQLRQPRAGRAAGGAGGGRGGALHALLRRPGVQLAGRLGPAVGLRAECAGGA